MWQHNGFIDADTLSCDLTEFAEQHQFGKDVSLDMTTSATRVAVRDVGPARKKTAAEREEEELQRAIEASKRDATELLEDGEPDFVVLSDSDEEEDLGVQNGAAGEYVDNKTAKEGVDADGAGSKAPESSGGGAGESVDLMSFAATVAGIAPCEAPAGSSDSVVIRFVFDGSKVTRKFAKDACVAQLYEFVSFHIKAKHRFVSREQIIRSSTGTDRPVLPIPIEDLTIDGFDLHESHPSNRSIHADVDKTLEEAGLQRASLRVHMPKDIA